MDKFIAIDGQAAYIKQPKNPNDMRYFLSGCCAFVLENSSEWDENIKKELFSDLLDGRYN